MSSFPSPLKSAATKLFPLNVTFVVNPLFVTVTMDEMKFDAKGAVKLPPGKPNIITLGGGGKICPLLDPPAPRPATSNLPSPLKSPTAPLACTVPSLVGMVRNVPSPFPSKAVLSDEIRSGSKSPLKSATTNGAGTPAVEIAGTGVSMPPKDPLPWLISTSTAYTLNGLPPVTGLVVRALTATARSSLPSPVKSAATRELTPLLLFAGSTLARKLTGMLEGALKVPSPLPYRMLSAVTPAPKATTMSGFPSPLKSPTTTEVGFPMARTVLAA